jgi:hypothetical protein
MGKTQEQPSPPPSGMEEQSSGMEDMMMMMAMMQMLSSGTENVAQQMPQAPTPLQVPDLTRTEDIDWTEKMEQLTSQASAGYTLGQAKKHGVLDTVHTSPLLDDEEINTTSIL